jgi:hypothetical protein
VKIIDKTDLICSVGAARSDDSQNDNNSLRTVFGAILLNAVSPILNFITVPISVPDQGVENHGSRKSKIDRNLIISDRY